jgi:hypothetical protein
MDSPCLNQSRPFGDSLRDVRSFSRDQGTVERSAERSGMPLGAKGSGQLCQMNRLRLPSRPAIASKRPPTSVPI